MNHTDLYRTERSSHSVNWKMSTRPTESKTIDGLDFPSSNLWLNKAQRADQTCWLTSSLLCITLIQYTYLFKTYAAIYSKISRYTSQFSHRNDSKLFNSSFTTSQYYEPTVIPQGLHLHFTYIHWWWWLWCKVPNSTSGAVPFSILPKETFACRPGILNQQPSDSEALALPLSHSHLKLYDNDKHYIYTLFKGASEDTKNKILIEKLKQK